MGPLNIRVVSYNVLSSHLASPSHFSTLNPEHLEASNRLPVVLQKLDKEIKKRSIICLQEVSTDWAGSLHTHFANEGYHVVTGLYGKKSNGYMGQLVAWPTTAWKALDVDISRLSDKREDGWPEEPKQGVLSQLVGWARKRLESLGVVSRPPTDHWAVSENRFNQLVTVKLEDKKSGRAFCLGNYHMPCLYYAPMVMSIHTDLAARHVQRNAAEDFMPYVLVGDWNIKPYGSAYMLLTTGQMDRGDPEWPTPKNGVEWKPTAKGMRSAYAVSEHGEPDFTNYARVKEQEPFIDTLDYIFLSDEWKVTGVEELPKRVDAGGPFPNLDLNEASDHILIAADLQLD